MVVGAAAVVLAALSVSPILSRSTVAEDKISGMVTTKDIGYLLGTPARQMV
ncbi:hypothetical protein I546_4393 [Mycobacterium kansasii 732]|nr:hypothetical protein I546_4393 [Mycobacterium kansasii 732]VAZ92819.1 hypothetical protein LAUMK35_02096 [Mycobacterium pseudokansasii]VAZ93837.1 hypothetical protein LAUMK21_02096 [Mycobacterium pseudokansasii]